MWQTIFCENFTLVLNMIFNCVLVGARFDFLFFKLSRDKIWKLCSRTFQVWIVRILNSKVGVKEFRSPSVKSIDFCDCGAVVFLKSNRIVIIIQNFNNLELWGAFPEVFFIFCSTILHSSQDSVFSIFLFIFSLKLRNVFQ